jgi:DNA-binding response OmpR family regulator
VTVAKAVKAVASLFDTKAVASEPETRASSRKKRVLIIDDEEEILDLISLILEPVGWEISTLTSGVGAAETVFRMKPDLVLLDIAMPGKDGIEVLESLAGDRHTAGVPVVIVSARTDEATIKRARTAGARYYLPKPFRNSDLLKIVESVVAKR